MAEEDIFVGKTREELKAFISTGVDAEDNPIDVEMFDERGKKSLDDLLLEHLDDETKLMRRADGRIVRCAWNVKIRIETPTRKLCEIRREYTGAAEPLERIEEFAVSETRKRSETDEATALRGVWEELRIRIPADQLKPLTAPTPVPPGDPTRESRVYADLLSLNVTSHFKWLTDEMFWETTKYLRKISKNGIIIPDHNVLIYLEWFEKKPTLPNDDGFARRIAHISREHVTAADVFAFLKGGRSTFLR